MVRPQRSSSSAVAELETFLDSNEDMIPSRLHDEIIAIFETVDDAVEELESRIEELESLLKEA